MYSLEKPAGQIFCGTHTVFGFSDTMNILVMEIELKVKLELDHNFWIHGGHGAGQ